MSGIVSSPLKFNNLTGSRLAAQGYAVFAFT